MTTRNQEHASALEYLGAISQGNLRPGASLADFISGAPQPDIAAEARHRRYHEVQARLGKPSKTEVIKPFFTKQEIIGRMEKLRAETGTGNTPADVNLALIILGAVTFGNTVNSGEDYSLHPLIVGMGEPRPAAKMIIGFLHDVLEDSDWTAADLKKVGFSKRIIDGVDAMTRRKGELYYDFIERCCQNPDALDLKMRDLMHNMDASRPGTFLTQKEGERFRKYTIALDYIIAIKQGEILPISMDENGKESGTSIVEFARSRAGLLRPKTSVRLLEQHSSRKDEISDFRQSFTKASPRTEKTGVSDFREAIAGPQGPEKSFPRPPKLPMGA
jgi:hypothetical protein